MLEGRQLFLDRPHPRSHFLSDALNLAAFDLQPAIGFELGRRHVEGMARGRAANDPQHPGRIACPQTQRLVQRGTALLPARPIVIVAP